MLPLTAQDIDALTPLQPPEWSSDIRLVFRTHIAHDYFEAVKIEWDGQIVAVGELIYLATSVWIGNVIVHPAYRRRGLGKQIMQTLMQKAGTRPQYLLATPKGLPLYEKLGFQTIGRYLFFEANFTEQSTEKIRLIQPAERQIVLEMDRQASGDERQVILLNHLEGCLVYVDDNEVRGFYIPSLGEGLVVAKTWEAGLSLLGKRNADGKPYVVVPEANLPLVEYLRAKSGEPFRMATFMLIGAPVVRQPKMVFSRIGGYIG